MSHEARLSALELVLPPAPKPMGVYKPIVITSNLAYLSGHGPVQSDGTLMTGRVGDDLDLDAGYQSARQVGLTMLATLQANLGSLDRVQRRLGRGRALVRRPRPLRHACASPFRKESAVSRARRRRRRRHS